MHADSTMTDPVEGGAGKPPLAFYIIGLIALAWNAIGVAAFVAQVTSSPGELGETPEQVAFYAAMPTWVLTALAVATIGGVAACVMLLIRNKQAVPLFGVSLIAVLVQDVHNFVLADALSAFGTEMLVLPVLVLVIGAAMLAYAMHALKKGWLR